mgnify:CR=1 FL=1
MSVEFEDYSARVKGALSDAGKQWLMEAAGELEAQVKRNTRVDTGQLKNSWTYNVDEAAREAKVGSPLENAIWEEFGTGQYALNGDGRKTAWMYEDRNGEWHKTTGKKPNRALNNAYTSLKGKLRARYEQIMKGLGS